MDKKKVAKAAVITLAQELRVDVDLRRVSELASQLGNALTPFLRRVRTELNCVRDGSQDGVPHIPLFVCDRLGYDDARLLFTAVLPSYPYLREVQLHGCGLGDDSVLHLVEFVKAYTPTPDKNPAGIECLELPNCDIGTRGAGYLGMLLAVNNTITRLVLDMNMFGDHGVVALCSALRWNSTLAHLSLQYCCIGPLGARAIADNVIRGSSVHTLLLRGNPLGEAGVATVGTALRASTWLQHLDLANTRFGTSSEAVEALCGGLIGNTTLHSVDMSLNTLASSALLCLLDAVQQNTRLVTMIVPERADADVYQRILDATAQNAKAQACTGKMKVARAAAVASR